MNIDIFKIKFNALFIKVSYVCKHANMNYIFICAIYGALVKYVLQSV